MALSVADVSAMLTCTVYGFHAQGNKLSYTMSNRRETEEVEASEETRRIMHPVSDGNLDTDTSQENLDPCSPLSTNPELDLLINRT